MAPSVPEAIDKSAKAHLKKNVLPKDIVDFHKIIQEKAAKQSMPKYSATPFDQETLDEYDQKDKLFKLMMKSMSYDKHPAYRALYDALVQSLIVDENDMDKQLEDPPTPKKRHEIVHDVEMKGGESVKEDVVDADDPSQVDASAPKHDRTTWFKTNVAERPESPDPEWHKEPAADDTPKQT
ncbi:hypothetical protein Tco_1111806 [Tanacetum coccineum]|uniref:Uncharacterized protein n=1 Tax=Tanacetum coccineum TaxID=301880 RepID=A0ABQ5IQC1_9ASTR